MSTPIPQPPVSLIPFLGNVGDLASDVPLKPFQDLAARYGEIYKLNIVGRELIVANSYQLINELSDEKRFRKEVGAALIEVRHLVSDGLFTAFHDEPNWGIAHRLLMPAFGAVSIRDMLEPMRDINDQLVTKWERFGPEFEIDAVDDFTKLALDTLSYCSMSHRLNSFYIDGKAPFAIAMTDFLKECGNRTRRLGVVQSLMGGTNAKFERDRKFMSDIAEKIVADRRAHPIEKNDLLDKMINGRDPKTGQGMTDDNIVRNLLTFMIAGHETTSGTLSFATYYLIKHPAAMRKLREEVDEVLGGQPAQYSDLSKLKYLNAVIRETLRLRPPASLRTVTPLRDTVLQGGYAVNAGQAIIVANYIGHRDTEIYGDDAEEFKPERMLDGKFEALSPNAWQPFGNGMRACIGRPFAWQEMLLCLSTLVSKFDLELVNPAYTLELFQALTIKPHNLFIRAIPRTDKTFITASPSAPTLKAPANATSAPAPKLNAGAPPKQPLYVLYGSNTGTSESFAQRIASDAAAYGFRSVIGTLDAVRARIQTDGPVIVVTASFEGEPADNAAGFVDWLQSLEGNELANVKYAVFGCGHKDWVATYQKIPTLIDNLVEQRGGIRLIPRGEGDSSSGEFFESFDNFEADLWTKLTKEYSVTKTEGAASGFDVTTVSEGTDRATSLRQPDAALGRVLQNVTLGALKTAGKRHIEFELPEGMSYRAGDYLAILPHNPPKDVRRALAHFSLSSESQITINSVGPTTIPTGKPINLSELLSGYVELSQVATSRDIRALQAATENAETKAKLQAHLDTESAEIKAKRISVLDLLYTHPDITLSLGAFLYLLPPMRVRQYSISSSPLWKHDHATITISVVAPEIAGREEQFLGVSSNYLAELRPGDRVQMLVRPSGAAFHPPADPLLPMVMFAAGSGLAPMRGFLQDRAVQKQSGRQISKSILFFGCRSAEEDYLYGDSDLKEWIEQGVVDVRPAFSRGSERSQGSKYVQDRVWHDREDIRKAFRGKAKFFTCGSAKMAQGVKAKLIEIIKEDDGIDDEEATKRFSEISEGRYATDIFD